jgi:hypothetical protein
MGKKTDEKILNLFKKRVIERDNELITKEHHSDTKEALTELTSLSAAEVDEIYIEAEKEVLQKEKKKRKKLLYIGAAFTLVMIFFWAELKDYLRKPTVFTENFERNNNLWNFRDIMTTSYYLENAAFLIDSHKGKNEIEYIAQDVNFPKNFSIEADLSKHSGQAYEYGLYLGYDNVNFAYFLINSKGTYKINAAVNGSWKPNFKLKESQHINKTKGSVNNLKVEVKGNNYEFFINGNSVEKGELHNIKMLQYSFAVEGSQKVSIDNLKITNIDTKETIYSNSFDKESEPWVNKFNYSTKSVFQNGGYVLESNTKDLCIWSESWFPKNFKKIIAFQIDLDATILSSVDEKSIFGFTLILNNKHNISFEVKNGNEGRINFKKSFYDSYSIEKSTYTGNFRMVESSKKDNIKLSIRKNSEEIEFYLNGVLVDKIGTEQLFGMKFEKMGLRVCSGIKVSFDNLEFKEIKQ